MLDSFTKSHNQTGSYVSKLWIIKQFTPQKSVTQSSFTASGVYQKRGSDLECTSMGWRWLLPYRWLIFERGVLFVDLKIGESTEARLDNYLEECKVKLLKGPSISPSFLIKEDSSELKKCVGWRILLEKGEEIRLHKIGKFSISRPSLWTHGMKCWYQ